ncbi:hypothetical protein AWH61_08080 [Alteromonas sp. W12]|uniref:signal peptidase I n=1 Tax=Alteromonas sp. W12 TaxID=1772289 RepID=UPI000949016E|nr:signal peptidase I [Alteromonas sp. W12]OLF76875.1 hypothetical protein AWH61_08080 [Alteromonas sp. W12]
MFKNSSASTKGKQAALEERQRVQFDERKRKLRLKYKQSKESAENNHENCRQKIKVMHLLFSVVTPLITMMGKCKESLNYKQSHRVRFLPLEGHNYQLNTQAKVSLLDKFKDFLVVNKGVFILVLGIILIRQFLFTWYLIPSASMNPNLKEGDLVFASKLAYNLEIPLAKQIIFLGSPERGDIVNFFYENTMFVKRVIAKEGDRIKMIDNRFYINGGELLLHETPSKDVENKIFKSQACINYYTFEEVNSIGKSYQVIYADGFNDKHAEKLIIDFKEFLVPENSFVMIGDNRNMSKDSRYIGLVKQRDINSKNHFVIINIYDVWEYLTGELDTVRFMIAL